MFSKQAVIALLVATTSATKPVGDMQHCLADVETIVKTGEAAYKAVESKDIQTAIEDVVTIVQTAKAAQADCQSKKVNDMSTCLADVEALVKDGKAAYAAIEAKNVPAAIQDIMAIVKVAKSAQTDCQQKTEMTENKLKMAQIMQGVLTQFGGHFNLMALLACIQEEDKAALVADAAVQTIEQAIETKQWAGLIGGAILAFAAVKQAEQGLPACEAIDQSTFDFKALSKATDFFTTPAAFSVISDNKVMTELKEAVADFEKSSFEQFGEKLGQILKGSSAVKSSVHVDKKDAASLLQGFFESSGVGEFNFTALLECVYVADEAAEALDMSVNLIMNAIETKDYQELIGGAIGIIAFVQGVKQAIPVCMSVDTNTSNWNVLNNTSFHPQAADLKESIQAFKAGDFYNFGKDLGKIYKPADPVFFL